MFGIELVLVEHLRNAYQYNIKCLGFQGGNRKRTYHWINSKWFEGIICHRCICVVATRARGACGRHLVSFLSTVPEVEVMKVNLQKNPLSPCLLGKRLFSDA